MHIAKYWKNEKSNQIRCLLCPHLCLIDDNETGKCNVRFAKNGKLFTKVFGTIAAIQNDPIEKKPLYHFRPGKQIMSIGTVGCNLFCQHCQNWSLARYDGSYYSQKKLSPQELIQYAKKVPNNIGIAYTYNEPTVFFEFMLECATLAKKEKMDNVMITNGFINQNPLKELLPVIDAFNVDIKGFSEYFYKNNCKSELKPILNTVKTISKSDSHLELTNLVIPEKNDNKKEFEEMCRWISDNCNANTVLHLSRYFPAYKSSIEATDEKLLFSLLEIAKKHINYVYLGNVNRNCNTKCRHCGAILIKRERYATQLVDLDEKSQCKICGESL